MFKGALFINLTLLVSMLNTIFADSNI